MTGRGRGAGRSARREGEDYQAVKDAAALREHRSAAVSVKSDGFRFSGASKDLEKLLVPQTRRKYHNQPVDLDGHHFDSKREAERYLSLRDDERQGKIHGLEVHPRFPLVIHGIDTGDYVADFSYVTADGVPVVEDVKSPATRKLPTYRLKRKMVWALYSIEIQEV